jgi:uncharacterized membrane protein
MATRQRAQAVLFLLAASCFALAALLADNTTHQILSCLAAIGWVLSAIQALRRS